MWIDEIKLIKESESLNENGFTVKSILSEKIVYGNRKSVRGSEFYRSSMAGMRIDSVFELKVCDYDGEELILFEGKRYRVIREYRVEYNETVELSVTDISEEKNV